MDNQQEYLLPNSWHGKRVKLTSVATDTIFDLYGGLASNGNRVIGYGNNGSLAQRWYLYKVDQNSAWSPWVLKNANSNTWLDLSDGRVEDNTQIQGWNLSWEQACANKNSNWFLTSYEEKSPSILRIQNAKSFTYATLTYPDAYSVAPWSIILGSLPLDQRVSVARTDGTRVQGIRRFEGEERKLQQWRISEA